MKTPVRQFTDAERDDKSTSPIVRHVQEQAIYFSHNDQDTHNSVERSFNAVMEATKKAIKNGWFNIVVEPTYTEGGPHNLDSYGIDIKGDRFETDEECNRRIGHLLSDAKRNLEECLRQDKLVVYYAERVQKYTDAAKSFKPKKK